MRTLNKHARSYLAYGLPLLMLALGAGLHEWWYRSPNRLASLAISGDGAIVAVSYYDSSVYFAQHRYGDMRLQFKPDYLQVSSTTINCRSDGLIVGVARDGRVIKRQHGRLLVSDSNCQFYPIRGIDGIGKAGLSDGAVQRCIAWSETGLFVGGIEKQADVVAFPMASDRQIIAVNWSDDPLVLYVVTGSCLEHRWSGLLKCFDEWVEEWTPGEASTKVRWKLSSIFGGILGVNSAGDTVVKYDANGGGKITVVKENGNLSPHQVTINDIGRMDWDDGIEQPWCFAGSSKLVMDTSDGLVSVDLNNHRVVKQSLSKRVTHVVSSRNGSVLVLAARLSPKQYVWLHRDGELRPWFEIDVGKRGTFAALGDE